jgi:hypothetical protein
LLHQFGHFGGANACAHAGNPSQSTANKIDYELYNIKDSRPHYTTKYLLQIDIIAFKVFVLNKFERGKVMGA